MADKEEKAASKEAAAKNAAKKRLKKIAESNPAQQDLNGRIARIEAIIELLR